MLYFFIQIFYCFKLKNQPIVDIFCIASGFLLRGIAGLVAAFLPISPWFLITIGLSALFLVIEKRKAEMDDQGLKVKTFTDYRKLLEEKDIDAVVIGTPDHWHALMMIHASEAGKHVYCEKPL